MAAGQLPRAHLLAAPVRRQAARQRVRRPRASALRLRSGVPWRCGLGVSAKVSTWPQRVWRQTGRMLFVSLTSSGKVAGLDGMLRGIDQSVSSALRGRQAASSALAASWSANMPRPAWVGTGGMSARRRPWSATPCSLSPVDAVSCFARRHLCLAAGLSLASPLQRVCAAEPSLL